MIPEVEVGKKKQVPHRHSPKAGDWVRDDNRKPIIAEVESALRTESKNAE
jgi:hypothetical protein